jgi:hypothetical protein
VIATSPHHSARSSIIWVETPVQSDWFGQIREWHNATMDSTLEALYDSLQRRLRPEDVAELVLTELGDDLLPRERRMLLHAARGSLKQGLYQLTSMAQDFARPVAPVGQVAKANELFTTAYPLTDAECTDLEKVRGFVSHISAEIRKVPERSDFKADRLDRSARETAGLDLSRRRYNKLFRFLSRFEAKLETYQLEQRKYAASRIAKSSLATRVTWSDYADSRDAACFVAYFTARSNRRSVFTNQSQHRPFDEVAKMLLERFKRQSSPAGWRAIAHVMPDVEIVQELSEADRMELFGTWLSVLHDIADLLQQTWERSRFDRESMIVQRGDDSSTWNALAGAWNAARQGWLGLVVTLGMDYLLDEICFGKVMRLMAADVAAWHRLSGGTLEPDTLVWAALPPPWEVFAGSATCTRALVENVCYRHGVNPVKKGWTFPRHERQSVESRPTPELVHGVAVSHPELAAVLRRAGWFSGKSARPLPEETEDLAIYVDPTGAVLGVTPASEAPDPSSSTEALNDRRN